MAVANGKDEMADRQSETLLAAIREASKRWQAAFNAGDAAGCAACYEEPLS